MALEVSIEKQANLVVICPAGEVDLYSSPQLRSAILSGLGEAEGGVAVDLSQVAYMDSSGVATLVEGLQGANKAQKTFVLVRPASAVLKVLQLARLDSVFTIRENV